MIIVPTEKKFDWQHAPVMLFIIVVINILIFFGYQNNDEKKYTTAFSDYQKLEYLDKEWPLFETYLELHKEQNLLATYRLAFEKKDYQPIVTDLLMRQDFYQYLQKNAVTKFEGAFRIEWEFERAKINARIQSVSACAYGLRPDQFRIVSFITHQFLHGSIMHLLGNMFFLIVCGFAVEAAIGHWQFLLFYVISGIAAGYSHVAFNLDSTGPLVGASGAISGVMAMYLAIFRLKKIEFFYWFFFFVGYIRAPALLILPLYIGKEVHSYYYDTGSNVAFMAHAGGFVAGAFLIAIAMIFNRSMLNTVYIETDLSLDPRQQKLAEIYSAIEIFRFDRALAAVDALIKAEGMNTELALIRYNMLKIFGGDEFLKSTVILLSTPVLMPNEIKTLHKVWQDNSQVHTMLSEANSVKLGIQFSTLDNPATAEKIFIQLNAQACKHPSMAAFAAKLAKAFSVLRDTEKKMKYEAIAEQLSKQHA